MMKRAGLAALLVLLMAVPAMAQESRLAPLKAPKCESLTDAQRKSRADIVGFGAITEVACTCTPDIVCTYTVKMAEYDKGTPPKNDIVRMKKPYYVGNGVSDVECEIIQSNAAKKIGEQTLYYLRKTKDGSYEPLHPRSCKF